MQRLTFEAASPEATHALGRRLGELLFPGAVLALVGQLGAGKTFLVRAIAEGLGVPDSRVVSSPTFVLIQEYAGRLPMYHFDTYRLKTHGEFADLGVHEYFEGNGVCLIEWADRVRQLLPAEHLEITLVVTGEHSRSISLEAHGRRYEELLTTLDQSSSVRNTSPPRQTWVPRPFGPRWLRNWLERHQHPFSFVVHLIGMPMTVAAIPLLLLGMYWWALGLFVGGYALQFIGHKVEGNDVGEVIPIKKLLGLPYVPVSPRWRRSPEVRG